MELSASLTHVRVDVDNLEGNYVIVGRTTPDRGFYCRWTLSVQLLFYGPDLG